MRILTSARLHLLGTDICQRSVHVRMADSCQEEGRHRTYAHHALVIKVPAQG